MKQTKKLLIVLFLLLSLTLLFAACNKVKTTNNGTLTVTFDSKGGSEVPSQEVEKGYKIQKPSDPVRKGYQFLGWTYGGEEWSFLNHTVSFDMRLEANWELIEYSITYKLNGGTNARSNPSTYTVESNTITFANPTRSGYNFLGWDVDTISHGSTGNVTVTANWSSPIVSTITYNLNGGTNSSSNPKSYTVNNSNITLANPTKTGYTFGGWYENPGFTTRIYTINTSQTKNYNLYAKWTVNTYQIIYSNTDGTGAYSLNGNAIQKVTYGSNYTLISTQERLGNTFLGWYNGTTLFKSGKWQRTSDITLTAKWQEDPALAPFIYESTATTCVIRGVKDKNVTNLVIPDYVTSIEREAFKNCTSLKDVIIGNGVTSIGNDAFYNCSSLTSVTIGNSVTSINDAFFNCSSLTSVYITDLAAWCNISFNVVLAHNLYLYLNGMLVTDLVIPDGVTSIGKRAFQYCNSLTSVTIPDSVTSIGDWAFLGCSNLTSVTIGNGVTSIGIDAFRDCSSLTSATIGNGVTSIKENAFSKCSKLTSITIGNSVTSIGSSAFEYCRKLTSIIYQGTKEQWNAISKGVSWNYYLGNYQYTIYCTDGNIKY